MQPKITFIYPIIRTDFIFKSLATLSKYTPYKDYKIIVIDQSIDGIEDNLKETIYQREDLYIRMKNAGFAKAANEGIIHALKWETPFIAVVNDDTEFMYEGWLDDALEEFNTDDKILAVCPESPRVAGWGYGLEHGKCIEIIPYKQEFTPDDIAYLKKGDYNRDKMQSHHDFTIPDSFPMTKRGVIDGIAMWLPIFKREAFIELGLFDERFIWGGGEDYCMLAEAYSCGYPIPRTTCDPKYHRRMVSTMKSWVWHFWGKSKDDKGELDPRLFEGREPWNDNNAIWGGHHDVWGHWTDENGVKRPCVRVLPKITNLL